MRYLVHSYLTYFPHFLFISERRNKNLNTEDDSKRGFDLRGRSVKIISHDPVNLTSPKTLGII